MLWLRKSKKGFTLIELMVVVAIIGVLSLLGLRLYTGQQEKAKNAIVKANAGTIQTLIQANLADGTYSDAQTAVAALTDHGMRNPYDAGDDVVLYQSGTALPGSAPSGEEGVVLVVQSSATAPEKYLVQGYDGDLAKTGDELSAER